MYRGGSCKACSNGSCNSKKAYHGGYDYEVGESPSTLGGGFVDELGKLAIPLGLIAAKEGVAAFYDKNNKKAKKPSAAPKKKPASAPKKKKLASAGRRGSASYGGSSDHDALAESFFGGWDEMPEPKIGGRGRGQRGGGTFNYTDGRTAVDISDDEFDALRLARSPQGNGGIVSTADEDWKQPSGQVRLNGAPASSASNGAINPESLPPQNSYGKVLASGISGSQDPDQDQDPGQIGGGYHGRRRMTGGAAVQHALIAQEFRRMASEIGSFLDSKAKKGKSMAAPKKPAPKKKAAPKKKTAASASAAPKKKKAAAYSGFW